MKFYRFSGSDSLLFVYMVGMRITGLFWLCLDCEIKSKEIREHFASTDTAFHLILPNPKPRPEQCLRLVCPFKMELMDVSSHVRPLTGHTGTCSFGNPVWNEFLPTTVLCSRHCWFEI